MRGRPETKEEQLINKSRTGNKVETGSQPRRAKQPERLDYSRFGGENCTDRH